MAEIDEATVPSTLVIVAALNEEDGVGHTLVEIAYFLKRPFCLVVDGHSTDGTVKIAEAHGAKVIAQKGLGKGDAIATAIVQAHNLDFEYAVFIDADYTYPAEHLPRMISVLEENPDVGMVCGNRFNERFGFDAMLDRFRFGNRLLAFTHNLLNGVDLKDPLTGLRAVKWEILKDWTPTSKGFDIEVELNHYVEKTGYHIVEIPIGYRPRRGEKKLKLRHGLTILARILRECLTSNRLQVA